MLTLFIPTYNRAATLPKTFAGLDAISCPDIEILFVDNASPDPAPALLQAYAKANPRVTVLRNPQNIGVVRSLHRGILSARHDWLVMLSDEDVVSDDYVRTLQSIQRSHPKVGAILVPETDYYSFPQPKNGPVIEAGGRRAAYCSYWVSGYLGGVAFNRQCADLSRMPLDHGIFVQRWLACSIALKHDVCFLPNSGHLRSAANPAAHSEYTVRSGDWSIREWFDHIELIFNTPDAASEPPADMAERYALALRVKVFKMFSLYMEQSFQRGGIACTEALIRAVLADPRFSGDLTFWEVLFNELLGMSEAARLQFAEIFERLRPGAMLDLKSRG